MPISRLVLLLAALALSGIAPAIAVDTASPALGTPLSQNEIDRWSITIFPDGRNLPAGSGNARNGAALYNDKCVACHGPSGKEGPASRLAGSDGFFSFKDPLRILRIRKNPLLLFSVGGQWPYATTVFDYIRRAMPHTAPKSLSNDEVYALTAYILYLNGLTDKETRLDATTLPRIVMPGRDRTVSQWPGEESIERKKRPSP
ncbi:MAG: cytochrome c [Parvibaculum sp.]|nr:cytochrome c [Parvibaculum sp.]